MCTHAERDWVVVATVKAVHPSQREITLAVDAKYADAIAWDPEWIFLRARPDSRVLKHQVLDWHGTVEAPVVTLGPGTPRDMVATMKGQTALIPAEDFDTEAVMPGVQDMAGFEVISESGETLGAVTATFATAHNAALEVATPTGNRFTFPWVEAVVKNVDLDTRQITVGDLTPYRVDDAD